MLYIDFIDTETGKQVFEEGKIIEAQQAIIDIIQLRFDHIPENRIQMIKSIGDLKTLIKLRKFAIRDQSKDGFIQHLIQYAPAKKWKIQSKKAKRGTDEAFYGLMKVSGTAVLKLIGIKPDDADNYIFKSIVLKEKKLEPDIVGFPVLENNHQKVFIEFQAYEYPFIKYNIVSKALMACAQDNDRGKVIAVIIYTAQKYKDAALSIHAFDKLAEAQFDHQIKELVLTDYTLEELLSIDPRLIILAPFTVPTDIPTAALTSYGRKWKKTINQVYNTTDINDAINVLSLFILNRFRVITREGIKAMLDFDILDTVAGRQVYNEGLEKGLEKGRTEGLSNMREMLELNLKNRFGKLSYDVTAAINSIKDVDYLKALFSKSFSYDNIDHFKKNLVTVNF
jgi:predicted transposase YdaD